MILKSKGFDLDGYWIPEFYLEEGEMIGLCLCGGAHFCDLEKKLVPLLTKEETHQALVVYQPLEFVERFIENKFRALFFPTTVSKYLNTYANCESIWIDKLVEINKIKPNTRISTLAGNYRKWLELFTMFSKTNYLVFDTLGQDILGARETLKYVKDFVERGGSAIMLDHFNDPDPMFDRYYKIGIS